MPASIGWIAACFPSPVAERSEIVARLRDIASLLELHGGNKFKARAYVRGARALESSSESLERLVEQDRLTELPGIGVALAHEIEELFRSGRSALLDSLRKGLPSGVLELSQVAGIGLHALRILHDELGISSVAELREAAEAGRLRAATGFGPKKEQKILEAIVRYESQGPTLLLADGLRLADQLELEIAGLEGVISVHLAGSLRRSQELSSDLDLVVETSDASAALAEIVKLPRVGSTETRAGDACRLRLADGTRVGITATGSKALPNVLLHAIASDAHFAKLQALAEKRGLTLTPTDLLENGESLSIRDERELYARLGLSWIPPEMREDVGEIELAAGGDDFQLIDKEDLRGLVHCHTTWSDGRQTIEEMALAAQKRGASFITITDHSAAAHYARGLDVDRLKRQWDEIAEVQERVEIRILRGTEADILADGGIDWPDAILEKMDIVIASIHARFRQDESKMMERVVRAMRHPVFKVWGHPLGRLVRSRPPIPLRVEEVLDVVAESRSAIEINGDPHRLDLEPKWVRAARERGIPFVLGVDAHSTGELGNVRYAVGLARRAGVRRNEVLNARSLAAFQEAVRPGLRPPTETAFD
ncbi:MAG: DNA polymerase/3'-5' exonuclease PolX [Myxococcota bacterium]|nr:DNA polymerase/3'-5' exonuclease PolX [Myxococcota bacterium]